MVGVLIQLGGIYIHFDYVIGGFALFVVVMGMLKKPKSANQMGAFASFAGMLLTETGAIVLVLLEHL
jgi:hypothetical protein